MIYLNLFEKIILIIVIILGFGHLIKIAFFNSRSKDDGCGLLVIKNIKEKE